MIGDVIDAMAGCLPDIGAQVADIDVMPFLDVKVGVRQRRAGLFRGDHARLVAGDQGRNALDVIEMAVGDENGIQRPPAPGEGGFDGPGIGRIDRRHRARDGITDEHAIIVGAGEKELDVHSGTCSCGDGAMGGLFRAAKW